MAGESRHDIDALARSITPDTPLGQESSGPILLMSSPRVEGEESLADTVGNSLSLMMDRENCHDIDALVYPITPDIPPAQGPSGPKVPTSATEAERDESLAATFGNSSVEAPSPRLGQNVSTSLGLGSQAPFGNASITTMEDTRSE